MAIENEQQQGEILLGNKQLLSIFFVVVVLLGVAFTIGYMIGKNTATVSAASLNVNPAPTRVAPTPVNPPAVVMDHPEPRRETERPSKAPVAAAPSPTTGGTYLQVAALKRHDADQIVGVLREHGFPALVGESPKEGLFRVLVGPFQTMTALGETKRKLRAAGFDSIVAK